jgi:cobalt-zinc-cadmium efflux system membrane fusion protein
MVEIRHGLKEKERVVAKGAFVLKSELLKGSIEGEEH